MTWHFLWDDWNVEHIATHGIKRSEAEYVVRRAKPPYPRNMGDGKFSVWGKTQSGRYLQVIFAIRLDSDVDYESMKLEDIVAIEGHEVPRTYVVHARELIAREKSQYRQSR